MDKIDILVLGGGYGTRLFGKGLRKDYSPKGLVDVNGKKAVEWGLDSFSDDLVRNIFIETNNEGFGPYSDWLRNSRYMRKAEIVVEPHSTPQRSLGVLETIADTFSRLSFEKPVLVLASDHVFSDNQDGLITDYKGEECRVGVYNIESASEASNYSVVKVIDGRVVAWKEKPISPKSTLVGVSCKIWNRKVFDQLENWNRSGGNPDRDGDFMSYLIDQGYFVSSFPVPGQWFDIGTPANLDKARKSLRLSNDKN